ncbi:MAG: thioredoxin-dependent thiol peroxidase [Alphaproteobacteria bacterium]
MTMPAIGSIAPDFSLPDATSTPVKLSDFRGKTVLIFFYPKALTPGCTVQACDISANLEKLKRHNVIALGISPDKPTLLQKFTQTHQLHETLLSDIGATVAQQYGVWQEKSMYGKTYMGIARTSFLINPQGLVTHIFEKVSPKTHLADVLSALS